VITTILQAAQRLVERRASARPLELKLDVVPSPMLCALEYPHRGCSPSAYKAAPAIERHGLGVSYQHMLMKATVPAHQPFHDFATNAKSLKIR
jgi:hypothetical protein